jgi:hypothetical protein
MNKTRLCVDGAIEAVPAGNTEKLLSTLPNVVELEPGYTLRSFFSMLDTYEALTHLNPFFADLLEQYHRGASSGCKVDGMERLVLEKKVEMVGFPGKPRLEIYRSFSGVRKGKSVAIKEFQVDMLLDMRISLGKLKHVVFGDQVDVFEFETVFTFFEFVEGIGWELGFHGTPKECQL